MADDTMTTAPAHIYESKMDAIKAGHLIIQLGAFRQKVTANGLKKRLREKGYEPYREAKKVKNKRLYYQVRLRGYTAMAQVRKERTQHAKKSRVNFDAAFFVCRVAAQFLLLHIDWLKFGQVLQNRITATG